jgi:peptide/nickel transport system permease protein
VSWNPVAAGGAATTDAAEDALTRGLPLSVSSRRKAWARFARNRLALVGGGYVILLAIVSSLATVIAPYDTAEQDITQRLSPPGAHHLLGTDEFGRDVLSRLLVGSRVSLLVGITSVLLVMLVGVTIGLIAGYMRGWDGPLMRVVDLFMSIPQIMLLLLLVALFGPGLYKMVLFIGLSSWMATARLVRGEVLQLRERQYVWASEGFGGNARWVVRKHLLPNVFNVVTVQATLSISLVILLESALSYLGLGVQPPTPTWGNMLSTGKDFMRDAWWITTFPGVAIFMTVMAFNFLGDGIRDALDVRS